jgi:lysozyme
MTTEIKKLDQAGTDLIAEFEGCVLHPYKDQTGTPTIGIGMTYYPGTGQKVTMSDKPLTHDQAYSDFELLVRSYELGIYSITREDLTQNQFNALVSLMYNIGVGNFKKSTVLRLVNQHITGQPLKDAFLMWNKSKGVVLEDLSERRLKEFNTYMS